MRKLFLLLTLLVSARCFGQAVIVSSSGDCAEGQPPVYNATTKLYDCQTIGTGGTGTLQNGLASGGSVAYTGAGLVFTVQAASYVIAGVAHTSAMTDVTLDAASGSNDRIDTIIVDNTGTATKITGIPAGPPLAPSVDPTSQLGLTFVYVAQSATTPSNITTANIYLENTEWTCAAGAGWNCASTNNPYAGTKDIEATAVAAGTTVTLTNGSPVSLSNYNVLTFYIRSKAAWNNNRSLTFQFLSGSTPVGGGVILKNGTFGYSSSTTGSYQQIAMPLQQFAPTSTITVLKITSSGSGGTAPGFYLDNIFLQGGLPAPSLPSGLMIFRGAWSATASYAANDMVTSGSGTYLALLASTNVTPLDGSIWKKTNTEYKTCMINIGAVNASAALVDADLGPQYELCRVNNAGLLVEVAFTAGSGTGTPSILLQKRHCASFSGGECNSWTLSDLQSGALAVATGLVPVCAMSATAQTCIDGTTSSGSITITNTALAKGDWIELKSGTAGGTAKTANIVATWAVN